MTMRKLYLCIYLYNLFVSSKLHVYILSNVINTSEQTLDFSVSIKLLFVYKYSPPLPTLLTYILKILYL